MSNFSVSEYLTKTFDLQIHLPFIEKVNMRTYAKNLLQEQKVKWTIHENISIDRVLGILIHTGVNTPRQVKKILNAFAFDWYLALKRDSEAGVEFLSKHPNHIAIFTVLKTDFPKFFHQVSNDPFIIQKPISEQINSINKESESDEELNEAIRYLEAFLSRVKVEMPADPRPFIYFNNELLNPLTGRPELQDSKEFLLNGQNDMFVENFDQLTDKDKQLVLSSTLEDIDVTDNIFVINTLKVLLVNNSAFKYTHEMDKNRWQRIISENLDTLVEYEILEVCIAFENLGCNSQVWESYGETISGEEFHEELFDLWINNPNLFDKLNIAGIGNRINSTFREKEKSHIIANSIKNVSLNNSINHKFNWIEAFTYAMLSNTLPDNQFCDWLEIWSEKTQENITTSIVNNLLDEFSFREDTFLEGVGDLWCDSFEKSDIKQADMDYLLNLMLVENFYGFTENNLQQISSYFDSLDYKSITSGVNEVLNKWLENDESQAYNLLSIWKSAPGAASFSSKMFSFDLEENNLLLVTEILMTRADKDKVPKNNKIVEMIRDEILVAKGSNRKTDAVKVVRMLLESPSWVSKFEPLIEELFPMDNNLIWLHSIQSVVEDHAELLISFIKTKEELAVWIIDSIFDLYKVKSGSFTTNARYRNYHTVYINIIIDKLMGSDKIDWNNFLDRMVETELIKVLEEPTIDQLLIEMNRNSKLDSKNYNEMLVTYHIVTSNYHQEIAAKRWDYFSSADRQKYLEKFSTSSELRKYKSIFGKKLLHSFNLKPDISYINELSKWNFDKNISNEIVEKLIAAVDLNSLNTWFENSIKKIIEGIDYWTMIALHKAVRTRKGINVPNKNTLNELLLLQDERSLLSLDMLKNDKSMASTLRKSIVPLKEIYPDEVEEIRKSFKWRKL